MILLDTNVLSELMRATPERPVASWIAGQGAATCFVFAPVEAATKMFTPLFTGRRRSFDSAAAIEFAEIFAARKNSGRLITLMDCHIASIARARGASIATRNFRDFQDCGVPLINPWGTLA